MTERFFRRPKKNRDADARHTLVVGFLFLGLAVFVAKAMI